MNPRQEEATLWNYACCIFTLLITGARVHSWSEEGHGLLSHSVSELFTVQTVCQYKTLCRTIRDRMTCPPETEVTGHPTQSNSHGAQLSLESLYSRQLKRVTDSILNDDSHPLHTEFQLIVSGRRFIFQKCRTKWYKNSFAPGTFMVTLWWGANT